MKPIRSRSIRYLLAILSFVVVISLLMHPELRMLAPFVDAVGLDGFLLLICAPLLSHVRTSFFLHVAPVLSTGLIRVQRSSGFRAFSSWTERRLSFLRREEYVGPIIPFLWIRLYTLGVNLAASLPNNEGSNDSAETIQT